jgi:hypothetical protein
MVMLVFQESRKIIEDELVTSHRCQHQRPQNIDPVDDHGNSIYEVELQNHRQEFPESSQFKQLTTNGAPTLYSDADTIKQTLTRESSNITFKTNKESYDSGPIKSEVAHSPMPSVDMSNVEYEQNEGNVEFVDTNSKLPVIQSLSRHESQIFLNNNRGSHPVPPIISDNLNTRFHHKTSHSSLKTLSGKISEESLYNSAFKSETYCGTARIEVDSNNLTNIQRNQFIHRKVHAKCNEIQKNIQS